MTRKQARRKRKPHRYAAKLLFQFRVLVDGDPGVRRLCEERIITFLATDARPALAEARKLGRKAQHRYRNAHGNPVFFEFVGVLDLIGLDPACEPNEVWYDLVRRVKPMERRKKLLPPESRLLARA